MESSVTPYDLPKNHFHGTYLGGVCSILTCGQTDRLLFVCWADRVPDLPAPTSARRTRMAPTLYDDECGDIAKIKAYLDGGGDPNAIRVRAGFPRAHTRMAGESL